MSRSSLRDRLPWALAAYALIAAAATFTLEGPMQWFIYLLMGAMAFKAWIAVKREDLENREDLDS